ncbi:MBG domain-containing protein [Flavobacterium sp. DG2-3]|uniref:MBG domain-containing protein n=1 Tax=Flavobacterium sp. DG2-3 TaxID=3068317 RepID=UPI00273E6BF0|nr:MBG domain-containing protein [Flavobacterium sp. DG2-3]MDP5199884.1 MBG domain-containing protein [Flavobacterium sp. DG2-3]
MKKKLLLFFTFFCLFGLHQNIKGQNLAPGDIAFIGYNSNLLDGFSFIVLKEIPAGTEIYFTERGWNATASTWVSGSTESHLKWTVPNLTPVGTIISVMETAAGDTFTVTGTSGIGLAPGFTNFNLSSGGDQVLAYQSTTGTAQPSSPIFIAGVNADYNSGDYNIDTTWNSNDTSGGNSSAKPSGLKNGETCISLFPNPPGQEYANAKYNGTLTGTVTDLLLAINNPANWLKDTTNNTNYPITNTNYPTPSVTLIQAPAVTTTTPVTNFGAKTATLGGSNDNGGATILNRGIVWSTTPNPVLAGGGVTNVTTSNGTGAFTVNATSLPEGTLIYYRAYAENSAGTSYGSNQSFTTNAALSATQSQTIACNGINNGTATVVPSGGKSPYFYSWSPSGGTGATATNLSPTNYSVTITDNEGTSIQRNFVISQNPAIITLVQITDVSCNSGNNGAIDISPSGGSGSYTYNWGGGITTQDRANLTAGTYSVTITDTNSCNSTINNIVVGQPAAALNGIALITNVLCNGESTGAINLTPTGGTGPYTYLWNDNITTTQNRTGLPVGTYSVTITDSKTCTKTITDLTITQPSLIEGTAAITSVACNGGNTGAINLVPSGGTSPYTFLWNDGVTTEDRMGLIAGTYTVTITDNRLCTKEFSYTITQPSAPLSALTGGGKTDVSCNGGANGTATVAPTGGTPGYTYTWNTNPVQTTATAVGLTQGTYTVTVTDANNCQTTRSFTINQPTAPLSAATGGGQTDVSCYGGMNGTATVFATGGTQNYTYSWNTTPVQTTATATGLAAGNYIATVTDANGCQATRSFTINQPTTALNIATGGGKTDVSCYGGANGTATVVPTGGTGAYTYSWDTTPVQTTATATGLAAGTYTVTVMDANSCTTTRSFTIMQPTAPLSTIEGTKQNTSCNRGANGVAQVIASGGTKNYTYSWNTTPVQTTPTATGLTAGTYTVTVTDANGCQTTRDFTITEPPALVASIGAQSDASCNGGTNGYATVNVVGGTGTYTYSWAPSGGTAATASGLAPGTYTVTVTDANLCMTTQSFTISQPSILSATKSHTDVLCNGGATGTATVTASGGNGSYTYSWAPSGGTAATATGLTQGIYTCRITDGKGCFLTESFTINQPPALTATPSKIDATCTTGGEAGVTPAGGAGGYTYLWTPGNETTQTISNLAAGNYSCLITDANGCTITKNFTIGTTNTLVATTSQTDLDCNGVNTGSASVVPSGATGPFTYAWSPSGGNSDTATNLAAGNYSVTITSGNGCSIVKNFTINAPPAIVITKNSQTEVSCNGGSNGSIGVTVAGGTGAYTYSWAPSGGTAATANGLQAGTYTLTVTDANSCIQSQTFTITEPDALNTTTSKTDVSCNGGTNGSATVNVTGGTGAYTYSWAPFGGTSATATGLSAGTYTVTVKDANLCQTTATVVIEELPLLTATIAKTDVLCNQANNGTATVTPAGGTGTYTYSWSPSGGTAATATGLSPNTYTVTVTDSNGCFTTATVSITEPTQLSATDSQTNVSCKDGNDGTASVVAIGGTGDYSYLWAPSGGTAATATGLSAGTYTVTVTDENSCSVVNTITITEPDVLSLTATPTEVSCYNGNNGSATVSVTGGTAPYSYSWSPSGGNAATATGLIAGSYTVTVTDGNSCSASATVEIVQPANPVTLNTLAVSEVGVTSVSLSGTASSNGINTDKGECLTEVGFVYALHANPTTADTKINVTASLGTFTNTLSGLRGNRTYYVRTYAINSNGVINYGNEVSFTTQKYTLTITAAAGHTKVYGTADPVFNYTPLGFANGDTSAIITGLLSRDAGENVGKYNIKLGTINAGADYTIVFTGAEFEITKANQIITWNQTLEFGCSDSNTVTLTATADSGLPISYTIANASLGTISGSTLNISGSGSSTITAVQNGDQNHNAATAVVKPIEVSQSGLVIQQWANVLFFDNKSNNYVAWQWYKNGVAVSGATRQYYSEILPLNGTYYVVAKDKNGNSIKSCPIETSGTIFTKKIKIYPNPVKPGAEFTLECDFSESQLNGSEVVIYDITGKLVQTISNVKNQNKIIAPSQVALYVVVLKLADGQLKTINLLVK